MITVWLPGDVAYKPEPCNESDWGHVMLFNDEIFDWLDEHCEHTNDWDHDEGPRGGSNVMIKDPKVALLFKLTWGGR